MTAGAGYVLSVDSQLTGKRGAKLGVSEAKFYAP
jgi:hypothetical protein